MKRQGKILASILIVWLAVLSFNTNTIFANNSVLNEIGSEDSSSEENIDTEIETFLSDYGFKTITINKNGKKKKVSVKTYFDAKEKEFTKIAEGLSLEDIQSYYDTKISILDLNKIQNKILDLIARKIIDNFEGEEGDNDNLNSCRDHHFFKKGQSINKIGDWNNLGKFLPSQCYLTHGSGQINYLHQSYIDDPYYLLEFPEWVDKIQFQILKADQISPFTFYFSNTPFIETSQAIENSNMHTINGKILADNQFIFTKDTMYKYTFDYNIGSISIKNNFGKGKIYIKIDSGQNRDFKADIIYTIK